MILNSGFIIEEKKKKLVFNKYNFKIIIRLIKTLNLLYKFFYFIINIINTFQKNDIYI